MTLNLANTVVKFLQERPEKKFTAREIAGWVFEIYPDKCRQKQKRSTATVNPLNTDADLIQQISAEIGSWRPRIQRVNPKIKTTEGRPRKYYFTEATDSVEVDLAEDCENFRVGEEIKLKEYDLYPLLSQYLSEGLNLYSMRIDEKCSRNSHGAGGNKWLYPDIVGIDDLSNDWHREVKDCVKQHVGKRVTLWSFEVKVLINRSNLREAFFQAVSNSSWANFGYLVASEIVGAGDNTLKELRILSSLHGIGLISLNINEPSESQVLIPAKERSEVDWDVANRLAQENKDFLKYIKLIRQFYQTGEMRQSDWNAKIDKA